VAEPGYQATAATTAAVTAAAAAAGGGGGRQPSSGSAEQQAAAAVAAVDAEEAEVGAITAEWSTRRRATPLIPFPGGRSSYSRTRRSSDESAAAAAAAAVAAMGAQLNSRVLEEGGALAVGAAAGAAAATAATAASGGRRGSNSGLSRSTLQRVLDVAAAVVGSPRVSTRRLSAEGFAGRVSSGGAGGGRRGSSTAGGGYEPDIVFPPVPMHPADKVLSMQVGLGVICGQEVGHGHRAP